MIFTQPRFFIFLMIVFLIHWSISNINFRKVWLLLCSLFFYGAWNWRFIPILLGITFIDYFASQWIEKTRSSFRRRLFLSLSLIANLTLLFVFKYYDFFVSSADDFLRGIGFQSHHELLMIAVPLGLSFHTFQAMAYTIDVFQNRTKPAKSALDFALFVSFFPQLVAGPIVRAKDFLPELDQPKSLADINFRAFLSLFLIGFFKKACLADHLSPIVDSFYDRPLSYSSASAWVAIILYSVQIYCDFSGYTDMAIACSGLFGFHLPPNFRHPYFSRNIQEFWHRWHISMSQWFRDYVYIPLGGSRKSEAVTWRNLMMTAGLSGLWHGADGKFIFWGLLHGFGLVSHRIFVRRMHGASFSTSRLFNFIPVLGTFLSVTLLWILFRAPSLTDAFQILVQCFAFQWTGQSLVTGPMILLGIALVSLHWFFWHWPLARWIHRPNDLVFYAGLGFAFAFAVATAQTNYHPFIYFQF